MQIGEFSTIVNLALLAAAYLIVQPLKAQIANLAKSIDLMSAVISRLQETLNSERIHIAEVDASAKSAHHRIDSVETHVEELQQRCINCNCRE